MIRTIKSLLALGTVSMLVTGCITPPSQQAQSSASTPSLSQPPHKLAQNNLPSLIYLAAQTLVDRAEGLARDKAIVVTTIVSVDDLKTTNTFSKLASEMIASRIQQRGFLVRDVTYTHAITVSPETGELALSRDPSRVKAFADAQAVVAGTYAVAGNMVYLNLRLIDASTGKRISSADAVIPREEIEGSFADQKGEMIPLDSFESKYSALAR